jgi:hypothetical protein
VVPVVVAAVFVGVVAAGVFVPALEPEAVPFKQLVVAKRNENTKSIIKISPHTTRQNRERSRLCRQSSAITESETKTSAW